MAAAAPTTAAPTATAAAPTTAAPTTAAPAATAGTVVKNKHAEIYSLPRSNIQGQVQADLDLDLDLDSGASLGGAHFKRSFTLQTATPPFTSFKRRSNDPNKRSDQPSLSHVRGSCWIVPFLTNYTRRTAPDPPVRPGPRAPLAANPLHQQR
eukprot:COSAG06_NODE_899_length_11665_cov_50.453052_2_plen_152_part_00